jgi:hypothetical protein
MNNQKGLIYILVVIAVIVAISATVYFVVLKKSSQPSFTTKEEVSQPIPQSESQLGDDNISRQEINKTKDLIESLVRSLRGELLKIEPTDTLSIVAAIKKYKAGFNSYTATINKLNVEAVDKSLLKSIRLAEWENYKLYSIVKQRFATNNVASQTIATTQKILDEYIKSNSIKSLSRIVIKPSKKSSALFPRFASKIEKMIINTVRAKEQRSVIHKKVILDPDDPGKSGQNLICWSYESWVDLESGNIRQEQKVPFGNKCQTEIDITEGTTGRKLGLNPVDKLAEWIIPPKIGIGSETKKDPYSNFKDKLENGEYILLGTDTFNGQEVYLLKKPVYNLDHEIIYLDAVSYLPVRSLSYIEDVIIEPIPGDSTRSNVIRTGKIINNFGLRFIVGEVIERESLPKDFFELKIPDGYELKGWVPQG